MVYCSTGPSHRSGLKFSRYYWSPYVPLTSRDSRSYTVDSRYRKHWFLRVSFKTFPSFSIHFHSNLLFLFYLITLEGRRGTTDEFPTIPFHLVLFSAALVEVTKSIPVHSIILSSHLFFCLPHFIFSFHCAL